MKEEQTFLSDLLSSCELCPRCCKADRIHGQTGFCGAGKEVSAGRAALHFWEEPCLSGTVGSGTVFFSYCTMQCVFCQNYSISTCHQGKNISIEQLSSVFLDLQRQGAWNINLVTPTHFVPQIILAAQYARKQGLSLPIVYNTSGYERVETIRLLQGTVDIYLPDLKYYSEKYGKRYSHAANYFETAAAAIDEMVAQVGAPQFDEQGRMLRGVIVRHLMLPGLVEDTKKLIEVVKERWGDQVFLSLMNQYTPLPAQLKEYPELNQILDPLDYDDAVSYAVSIGIRNGFIQEDETAKESFIPSFQGEGLERIETEESEWNGVN